MSEESRIHILWLPTIAAAGIAYVASMIDFLPDALFGIGWLDDLAVLMGMVWFFTSWLPKNRHRLYWSWPGSHARAQGRQDDTDAPAGQADRQDFDPFGTLNVREGASSDEIRRAYRELLSKYHPDKVAHLGKEFQQIAHEKTIDIRRAYEMLCGKG